MEKDQIEINIKELQKILSIEIKNKKIWQEALTHKSWLFFHPEARIHDNERLEFLGDSILQAVVSIFLYEKFSNLSEGEMSLIRSKIVSRDRLEEIAYHLGLERLILMKSTNDIKGKKTILGNTLEAIIGALFLDSSWEKTVEFIKKNILSGTENLIKTKNLKDPKTFLQELFLHDYKKLPQYKLVSVTGPAHKQIFKVEVYLDNEKLAEGEGSSKQEAETEAATKAINKIYLKEKS